jgi:hypothetical protein
MEINDLRKREAESRNQKTESNLCGKSVDIFASTSTFLLSASCFPHFHMAFKEQAPERHRILLYHCLMGLQP